LHPAPFLVYPGPGLVPPAPFHGYPALGLIHLLLVGLQ
jgi:hypothetical protein